MKKILGWFLAGLLCTTPATANQSNLWSPTTGTVSGLQLTNSYNGALTALATCNSGTSAPANDVSAAAVKGQCWLDTSVTPNIVKIFDGAANWLTVGYLDAVNHIWTPVVAGGVVSTIASAGTTDLCSAKPGYVEISGVVTITSFGSNCITGQIKWIRFQGALLLTHNASSLILPNNSQNITTVANDTAVAVYLGSGNWRVTSYIRASGSPLSGGASSTVLHQDKTANYPAVAGDSGTLIDAESGTWTLTLPNPVTVGNGWWIYFNNRGTGNITITPSAGTIDGISTFVAYPGEARFISSDGTNFQSIVIAPFNFVITATGATTFTVPPGYQSIGVTMCGGGGGGAGGGRSTGGTFGGGGGGGGGYCWNQSFQPALLSTSQTVTIGTGGTHGNGATVGGNSGSPGSAGTASTFGSLLTANGGDGGNNNISGGGGGGGGGPTVAGAGGSNSSSGSDSEFISNGFQTTSTNRGGCAGSDANSSGGAFASGMVTCGQGGGGGGGAGSNNANPGVLGSNSLFFGGPGGGGGGGTNGVNAFSVGGNGGKSPGCQTAPVPSGGSTSASAVYLPGCGGAGGNGVSNSGGGPGGPGGAGTNAGGGGGGGSGSGSNGGAGGDGGSGFAWIKGSN